MQEQTNVRGVERDLWRALRAEAVLRGVPVAQLLNAAISEWLARHANEGARASA